MANFYKDNIDIIRDDIVDAKEYVRETIFAYTKIRNGYFHKHNIHDWKKIEEIRSSSFQLLFLVLGAQKLSEEDKSILGKRSNSKFDDYYKLCEYVNYHSNELFFLNFGEEDQMAIAYPDVQIKTIEDDYIAYSGVYFGELREKGRVFKFDEKNIPNIIYSGKFVFSKTELVDAKPTKKMKIFENGKFIGPSIVDEDKFSY